MLTAEQLTELGVSREDAEALREQFVLAWPALAETLGMAIKAFAKLGEQLRPAVEQAVRELNDCGYTYDAAAGVFVRTAEDNPIPVHRLLRYVQRSPQNRRRVRERRKAARRVRRRSASEVLP